MIDLFHRLYGNTGFAFLDWRMLVMWAVVAVLLYLAVYKKFEPLLLVPIAFGAMLANLPTQGIINKPASVIRAPVSGEVLLVNANEGQFVKLNAVEKVQPQTVGEIGAEIIAALIAGESVDDYGSNSLLYVMRDASTVVAEDEVIMVGEIALKASDVLIWSDASGRVVSADIEAGAHLIKGAELAELHSSHTGGLFHYIDRFRHQHTGSSGDTKSKYA